MRQPELIGHRGAPREHVENTLPAFERALALGAAGIELDVHLTRDGEVVVHHDPVPHARAVSGGEVEVPVAELSLDEIRRLRFQDGSGIPTLHEVLELVAERATVYVEVKAPRATEPAVRMLRESGARCAVHAFDHRVAVRVRELAPEIPTGILLDSYLVDPVSALRAAGARDWWQRWEMIDEELVSRVHGAGGRVVAWTVNHPRGAAQLAAIGVDALCSDVLPTIARSLAAGA